MSTARHSHVHLHVHSHYSLEDGLLRIEPLAARAAALGMSALALTEQDNLFSAIKFYQAARRHGIKPIIGAELRHGEVDEEACSIVLLCQNLTGYRQLCQLIARAYRERGRGEPRLHKDWLEAAAVQGLIALSGGTRGEVERHLLAGDTQRAQRALGDWMQRFPGRFYLEVQRTGRHGEDACLQRLLPIATAAAAPVVATNDVRFLGADDFEAHEARVCIHANERLNNADRQRRYTEQQHLRSPGEMCELFSDLPEALDNSVAIAERCNLELTLDQNYLPEFSPPAGQDQDQYITAQARTGLQDCLNTVATAVSPELYHQRLDHELKVITKMGFAGYFLIVADFVNWARQQGIPVGPGRGSGGGSLVAYALGITEIDPLQHGLLFERFLNPERVSMPDFDIDFCMHRRDEVLDYARQKFGRDRVAQIVTYGSMNARAVVRDCGRILGHPHGFVDKLAKLIPPDLDMTLDKAMQSTTELGSRYRDEDGVRVLIDLARQLEGTVRHAGRHAGGIVIAPGPLLDFVPLLYLSDQGEEPVTQYDMNDLQKVGLVKFDFLGLRTLTIIDDALRAVNAGRKATEAVHIESLSLSDPRVYELICSGRTGAIFQLESEGMRTLIANLKPDCFKDLVALLALFRPGPLGAKMLDVFCDAKHGRKAARHTLEQLAEILSETHGVILYQEQVMEIARSLAGYSMGKADLLRRAMGKKDAKGMARHRCIFVEHAEENGVATDTAHNIFDQMEQFGRYGFNKSHSTAYALLSYRTAWLKVYYPAEFMAAALSSEMDHTERLNAGCDLLGELGLRLLPPAVNHSDYGFVVSSPSELRYGLGAVRGLGRQVVEELVRQRQQGGPYRGLYDLCYRQQPTNRQMLEALLQCGALDEFGVSRSRLQASLESVLQRAEQARDEARTGQLGIFAGAASAESAGTEHYVEAEPWSMAELLQYEKTLLGRYFSGHPFDRYSQELAALLNYQLAEARDESRGPRRLRCAGMVTRVINRPFGKRRMFLVYLEDATGRLLLRLPAEKYDLFRDQLQVGNPVYVQAEWVTTRGDRLWLDVQSITSLTQLRLHRASLRLRVGAQQADALIARHLPGLWVQDGGGSPVIIEYHNARASAELRFGKRWRTRITDTLVDQLRHGLGADNVRIRYDIRQSGE